jgi:signal transduction histidine kinase/CheY-like chemotaxis protein
MKRQLPIPANANQPDEAALFDVAPDPMALFASDGGLIRANDAFRRVFRQEIGPRRAPWGRVAPPPFDGDVRSFEAPAPDGRLFEWRERRLPNGQRLAAARDVAARAAAAAETARAKTLLFATLTHELRTPLNGILGMAGLLEDQTLDAAGREQLSAIRTSGEHLLDLITEILDFSRLESGRVMLEEAVFDPEATAQSVAELLSPRAREKGLEIVVTVDPAVPARLTGDEGRLKQILFNLAGNAVKFTERGGVTLDISPAGKRVRFTVRDTGPGIDANKQAAIFEAFGQADASHARLYGGAGLGLAIVRKLADALGGTAGVRSRPGEGAAFWVDLPFASAAPLAAGDNLSGLSVAVMAFNDVLAGAVTQTLAGLGARAHRIRRVDDAGVSDVLMVDHDVTCGDARAFLAQERPLVLMAPQEARESIADYRAQGVSHFVLKPLRRRSLVVRLRAAVDGVAPQDSQPAVEDDRAAPAPQLGLRVLLAEDNPINALLAKTLLQRAGCTVDVVGDGEEAVRAAGGGYDLIFLDLRMPRLDGFAAARHIRTFPGAPILVALTADAGESERQAALAAGMDDFVTKPIDPERLAAVVARFTGRTKPGTL